MIQFRCLQCGKETELEIPGRFEEPPFLWPLDHTCPECLHRESDAAEGDDAGDVEPPVDDDLEDHFTHFQF
jgi:hypothetical protein